MQRTKVIRILTEGIMDKLMEIVRTQYKERHGFIPTTDQLQEDIATAVMEKGLFK